MDNRSLATISFWKPEGGFYFGYLMCIGIETNLKGFF